MIPEVGMYVKKRSGGYGKVTSINSDGTYDIAPATDEEVEAALDSDEEYNM